LEALSQNSQFFKKPYFSRVLQKLLISTVFPVSSKL
jgi:hypothetical protein